MNLSEFTAHVLLMALGFPILFLAADWLRYGGM